MEHAEYTYTYGMDDAGVERCLRTHDTGVLSLARAGEAYGIPVSYRYDDGCLLLRLGYVAKSKKAGFLEATETACLTLYGYDDAGEESWSVVVTGPLRELVGDEFDLETVNESFASLRVFDEPVEELSLRFFRLEVEEATGRKTERGEQVA